MIKNILNMYIKYILNNTFNIYLSCYLFIFLRHNRIRKTDPSNWKEAQRADAMLSSFMGHAGLSRVSSFPLHVLIQGKRYTLHDLSDVFPKRPNRDMTEGDHEPATAVDISQVQSLLPLPPSLFSPSHFVLEGKEDTRIRD